MLEQKKKQFMDTKIQLYDLITNGKYAEAKQLYNTLYVLYKELLQHGTPIEQQKWNADLMHAYTKLQANDKKEVLAFANRNRKVITKKVTKSNTITTNFDTILDLIKKRGRLNLADIEERFSIPKKLAEEWAQILADHDLVEIHYLPIGGVEITAPQKKAIKP